MKMPKILNGRQIHLKEDDRSMLSYEMIFSESATQDEDEKNWEEQEEPDVEELLNRQEQEWIEKLKKAREESFNRGREEGRQAGLEQARAEMDARISTLENAFSEAHSEWNERQRILDSGLIELTFEISEQILGIPVENPAIREKLEMEITELLQKVDEQTKPLLLVSEKDYEFVERLKDRIATDTSVLIKMDKRFNPGEFSLETCHETVIHKFRELLDDFKDSLSLPSWKA